MSVKGAPQVRCLYDSDLDDRGDRRYSCHRVSLPARLLCHKHAGQVAAQHRRRAKNKVARATRKAARA